jgi:hypothetical protein
MRLPAGRQAYRSHNLPAGDINKLMQASLPIKIKLYTNGKASGIGN